MAEKKLAKEQELARKKAAAEQLANEKKLQKE
jgi:hypothetical protein